MNYLGLSNTNTFNGDVLMNNNLTVEGNEMVNGNLTVNGTITGPVISDPVITNAIKTLTPGGALSIKNHAGVTHSTFADNGLFSVNTMSGYSNSLLLADNLGNTQMQLNNGSGSVTAGVRILNGSKLNVDQIESQSYETANNPTINLTNTSINVVNVPLQSSLINTTSVKAINASGIAFKNSSATTSAQVNNDGSFQVGTFRMPSTSGTAGSVLTTDGIATASWNPVGSVTNIVQQTQLFTLSLSDPLSQFNLAQTPLITDDGNVFSNINSGTGIQSYGGSVTDNWSYSFNDSPSDTFLIFAASPSVTPFTPIGRVIPGQLCGLTASSAIAHCWTSLTIPDPDIYNKFSLSLSINSPWNANTLSVYAVYTDIAPVPVYGTLYYLTCNAAGVECDILISDRSLGNIPQTQQFNAITSLRSSVYTYEYPLNASQINVFQGLTIVISINYSNQGVVYPSLQTPTGGTPPSYTGNYGFEICRMSVNAYATATGTGTISQVYTDIIYQPGGISSGNLFATWTEVVAKVGSVGGMATITIDDSLSSPAFINANLDCKGLTRFQSKFTDPTRVTCQIVDGVALTNPLSISGTLSMITLSATQPGILLGGGAQLLLSYGTYVINDAGSAVPGVALLDTSYCQVQSQTNSIFGTLNAIPLLNFGTGQRLAFIIRDGGYSSNGTFASVDNTSTLIFAHDASLALNTFTFAGFSGSYTEQLLDLATGESFNDSSAPPTFGVTTTQQAIDFLKTGSMLTSGANSMAADINAGGHKIINILDPTSAQDAASKIYVDSHSPYLNIVYRPGGVASGNVFTTWAGVIAKATDLNNAVNIYIDDSLSFPAIADVSYDFGSTANILSYNNNVNTVNNFQIIDTVTLSNPRSFSGYILVACIALTTSSIQLDDGRTMTLNENAVITNANTATVAGINVTTTATIIMNNRASIQNNGVPTIILPSVATLTLDINSLSYIQNNSVSSIDSSSTLNIQYDSSFGAASLTNAGFTGTLTLLPSDAAANVSFDDTQASPNFGTNNVQQILNTLKTQTMLTDGFNTMSQDMNIGDNNIQQCHNINSSVRGYALTLGNSSDGVIINGPLASDMDAGAYNISSVATLGAANIQMVGGNINCDTQSILNSAGMNPTSVGYPLVLGNSTDGIYLNGPTNCYGNLDMGHNSTINSFQACLSWGMIHSSGVTIGFAFNCQPAQIGTGTYTIVFTYNGPPTPGTPQYATSITPAWNGAGNPPLSASIDYLTQTGNVGGGFTVYIKDPLGVLTDSSFSYLVFGTN